MIVPMQKVAVLCAQSERTAALVRLQQFGLLHLVPGQPVGDDELAAVQARLERLQRAHALLDVEAASAHAAAPPPVATANDADAVAARVEAAVTERAELLRRAAALAAERAEVAPFGEFDPAALRALAAHGVHVGLYRAAEAALVPVPAGASLHVLGEAADGIAAAVVAPPGVALAAPGLPVPARSLSAVERDLTATTAAAALLQAELTAAVSARPVLRRAIAAASERRELLTARAAMGAEGAVAWLTGFCPADRLPDLRALAATEGLAVVDLPTTADDVVPTLLRSPKWVQQVQAVLDMLGITPGYSEPDVGWLFLLFLVVFASMLIGDAGYGVLLLVATFAVGRGKPAGQAVRLLRTLSGGTIVWGALTGTWFAIPQLPSLLDALRVEWLAGAEKKVTERHIMLLCFLLGAIHITLAHLWAAFRCGKSLAALAQIGWIASTWTMFAIARTMVLGDVFPSFMVTVAIVGIAAIALFMTPPRLLKAEWFNHVMLPLSLVSNFVDVVSYLRLFAVGTAGVAVAQSFNAMASDAASGGGMGWLLAALIAVFGHTLNLALCAMGVLVHGVRLNTLEFSSHLGLQWNGTPYRPFARQSAAGGTETSSSVPVPATPEE